MLKLSKINIAKQKISELNKKYSKKLVLEDSSSENSISLKVKERLSKVEETNYTTNSDHLDSSIKNSELAEQLLIHSKFKDEVKSYDSSKITTTKSKSDKKKEFLPLGTMLNVDFDKEINEVRNITPTGVSKRLANVFIISSSDEEELSEDINIGQITDKAKSYTSTSARTISEDIVSGDVNKKNTPRSIKFVRIDTPILVVKEQDENVVTNSTVSDKHGSQSFSATIEDAETKKYFINSEISSKDESIASKLDSESFSSIDFLNSGKPKEKDEVLLSHNTRLLNNSGSVLVSNTTDFMTGFNNKPKNVLSKSKHTQTELKPQLSNKIKPHHYKQKDKINEQNRPTLKTSTLYRFSDMTEAEINYVCSKVANTSMEDFAEDESSLSLELIIQQFLKRQVVVTRHLVETHHRLYLNYCKSVHHMCKLDN